MTLKIKKIENNILAKCKVAIALTQANVCEKLVGQSQAFYDDYDPVSYDRTGQLRSTENFIKKSDIVTTNNGCYASVGLDVNGLSYHTGKPATGEQVVNAAVRGLHGAIGDGLKYVNGNTGAKLWDGDLQGEAKKTLIKELRKQGIPIK